MIGIRPRRIVLAAAVLALGGLARLPLEEGYTKQLREARILEPKLDLSLRDQMGQSFFIAVLGGFRSLVASIIEVQSLDPWQKGEYSQVDAAYALCTSLQPQEWHYWDFRAWMAASNAWDYYAWDENENRGQLKEWLLQGQIDHAIAVLEEARKYLPDDYRVIEHLALLYGDTLRNRQTNHAKAAEYYEKAAGMPNARSYLWRNHVYQLAQVPGREVETYRKLLDLYNHKNRYEHTPTVDTLLCVLYPTVKLFDPTALLPGDLPGRADELRQKWREMQARMAGKPVPRVTSPALAPAESG